MWFFQNITVINVYVLTLGLAYAYILTNASSLYFKYIDYAYQACFPLQVVSFAYSISLQYFGIDIYDYLLAEIKLNLHKTFPSLFTVPNESKISSSFDSYIEEI